MSDSYLQLRKISYVGSDCVASLSFASGVNVICGASDTGKSFLIESVDFMLGGSELRKIVELTKYNKIELDLYSSDDESFRFSRSITGGNFQLTTLSEPEQKSIILKQKHDHGKTDNVSGFLLDKIGLSGKKFLEVN